MVPGTTFDAVGASFILTRSVWWQVSDTGFAQIIVLGALATIGGLLASALPTSRTASTTAAAHERSVRIDFLSASAFRRGLVSFEDGTDDFELRALRTPVAVTVGDRSVVVLLESEGGKIDVLRGDLQLLARLAEELGLQPGDVAAMLRGVKAAREQGDVADAMAIVRRWLAVPADDLDALVTMRGGSQVDPTLAPAEVLSVIPDLNPAQVAQILAVAPQERGQFAGWSRHFGTAGRSFAIVARIDWAEGQRSIRRLPIELSTSGQPVVLGGAY